MKNYRKLPSNLNKQKGFTLLEMLLAVVILAIGLIGLSLFYYADRKALVNAKYSSLATWSAVNQMEYLKTINYAGVVSSGPSNITLSGYNATMTTTVTPESGNTYAMVTVHVTCGTQSVSLVTYIFNPL